MKSSQLDLTQKKLIEFSEFKNLSDDYLKVWGDTVVTPQFTDDESVKKEQHSFGWGQIQTNSIFDSYGDVASYKSDPSAPPINYGQFNQLRAKLNGAVFHTDANVNRLTDFLFDDPAGNKLRVESTHYNQNQKQVEYLYTQEARFLCARYDTDVSISTVATVDDVADPKIINRLFPTEYDSPVNDLSYGAANTNEIFDGKLKSVVKATFDSYNDARHFFNSGGFVFFQLESDEEDVVDEDHRSWSGLFYLLNQIRFTAMHTYANGGAWAQYMTSAMQEMNAPFDVYNTNNIATGGDKRRGFYSLKDTTREVFRVRIGSINPIYKTKSAYISGEYLDSRYSRGDYAGTYWSASGLGLSSLIDTTVDNRQWPYHYTTSSPFSSSSYGQYGEYPNMLGTFLSGSGYSASAYLSGMSDRRDLAIYARAEDNTDQPGGKFIIYFQIQLEEEFPDDSENDEFLNDTSTISNLKMDAGSYTPADIPAGNSSINAKMRHDQVFYQFKAQKMPLIELDTSWILQQPADETFLLSSSASVVNEGDSFTYTLTTSNVDAGRQIPYTITGVESADIDGVSLTGNFTIGADGTATQTFVVTEDGLTEGVETFNIALDNGKDDDEVIINDSSITDPIVVPTPSYSLTVDNATVNEGETFKITLNAFNVSTSPPTAVPYTITGVDSADIDGAGLTGSFTVDGSIIGMEQEFTVTEDISIQEGVETFTLTIDGTSVSVDVTITDSSIEMYQLQDVFADVYKNLPAITVTEIQERINTIESIRATALAEGVSAQDYSALVTAFINDDLTTFTTVINSLTDAQQLALVSSLLTLVMNDYNLLNITGTNTNLGQAYPTFTNDQAGFQDFIVHFLANESAITADIQAFSDSLYNLASANAIILQMFTDINTPIVPSTPISSNDWAPV